MTTEARDNILKSYELYGSRMAAVETHLLAIATITLGGLGYFYSSENGVWTTNTTLTENTSRFFFLLAFSGVTSFAYSMMYVMMTAHDRLMLRLERALGEAPVRPIFEYYNKLGLPREALYVSTAVSLPLLCMVTSLATMIRVYRLSQLSTATQGIAWWLYAAGLVSLALSSWGITLCLRFVGTLWKEAAQANKPLQPPAGAERP
jgi:hypothetical protein